MFYLMLNMLLAIVLDAYSAVKESGANASPIWRDALTFTGMYRRRVGGGSGELSYSGMSKRLAPMCVGVAPIAAAAAAAAAATSATVAPLPAEKDGSTNDDAAAAAGAGSGSDTMDIMVHPQLQGTKSVAARMWREVDIDGNGKLDPLEVIGVIRRINSGAGAKNKLRQADLVALEAQIMADMDADGDGIVTESEFLRWWDSLTESEQVKLVGGVAMTEGDIALSLNLPQDEAVALFKEVQEDVNEHFENEMQQEATKQDLESSVTQLMLMLRTIDTRLAKIEQQQQQR